MRMRVSSPSGGFACFALNLQVEHVAVLVVSPEHRTACRLKQQQGQDRHSKTKMSWQHDCKAWRYAAALARACHCH